MANNISEKDAARSIDSQSGGSILLEYALILGLFLLWGPGFLLAQFPPTNALFDFVEEWTSAKNFFAGKPVYRSMKESIPEYVGPKWRSSFDRNPHPPASILLALPFAKFTYWRAHALWNLCSLVAFLWALWNIFFASHLAPSFRKYLLAFSLLFPSYAVSQQVYQGQLNFVLLLLVSFVWIAIRTGRSATAGITLGIAGAVKVYPLFLGLYFLARRDWRAVGFTIVGFIAANLMAVLFFGSESIWQYVFDVTPLTLQYRDTWPNASLSGYWSKLFNAPSGRVVPLFQAPWLAQGLWLITSLAITWTAYRAIVKANTPSEKDCAFCLCIVGALLVSPITWEHYFILLIIPAVVILTMPSATRWEKGSVLALMWILVVFDPRFLWSRTIAGDGEGAVGPGIIASVAQPWQVLTVISVQFYCLLLFFFLLHRRARPGVAERSAPQTGPIARAVTVGTCSTASG